MANLLQKASIVLTPTAYDNGKVLCAKPSGPPYGDFDFSRNSAATRVNAQGLVENVQILSSNLVQNGDFSEEGVQEVSNGSFSQEGVEQISNGSFDTDSDWAKGTGWSIANGTATYDGTGGTSALIQNGVIEINKTYKVTIDVISNEGSGINTIFLGNNTINTQHLEVGSYTFYGASTSGIGLAIYGRSGEIFKIDNVSVREVGQDWTLATGWSIAEDKAINNGTSGNLYQSGIIVTGKQYKIQATILDYVSGDVEVSAGAVPRGAMSANGTYTFYQTASSTSNFFVVSKSFNGSITNISVKEVGQNWNLNGEVTIGGSLAHFESNTNTYSYIRQDISSLTTKTYKIQLEVKNYVSGAVQVAFSGASPIAQNLNVSTDGVYTAYLTPNANGDDFEVSREFNGGNFNFEVTNISVIEITDDTNLPRINYEGFSYQDALGSELITNGDFATDTGWNKGTGWSISDGKASFDGGSQANIIQADASITIGNTFKVTLDVSDMSNGEISVRLGGGAATEIARIQSNGSYVFYGVAISSNITFRALLAFDGSIDNVSVKEYLGQEVVPDSGCGSWLWEPQSTNLITYSEDFSQWNKGLNTTISPNYAISPDGTQNATRFETPTGGGTYLSFAASMTIGSVYTLALYLKNNGGENVDIGVASSSSVGAKTASIEVNLTNEWVRYELNFTADSNSNFVFVDNINNANSIDCLIWGAMLEQNSFSTSYIPTSGSTVTRNRDLCNNGGSLASINSGSGTFFVDFKYLTDNDSSNANWFGIESATGNSRVLFYKGATNNQRLLIINNLDIVFSNTSLFNIVKNQQYKLAVRYDSGNISVYLNGTEIDTSTNTYTLPIENLVTISLNESNQDLGCKLKSLVVWKEGLSDQELADLTYPTPTDPTFALDFDTIATDFTFARGSEATYVDAQGLIQSTNEIGEELITNGDFATDSDWSKQEGWTISGGTANANMILGGNGNIYQSALVVGKTYELTFTVSNYVQGYIRNVSQTGSIPLYQSNGTFTETFVANNSNLFMNANAAASTQLSIDNVSVKEYTTATNTPRLDYSTGAEAFLLEPQSTNLAPYSEDFSQRAGIINLSIGLNEGVSPSGEVDANLLSLGVDASATRHRLYSLNNFVLGNEYTFSVFAKKDEQDWFQLMYGGAFDTQSYANFDLANGVVGNVGTSTDANIVDYGNGWYRCSITCTATATISSTYEILTTNNTNSGRYPSYQSTANTNVCFLWGAMLEAQSYATSYIPTSVTTVTRNQETCINATPEINSEEGVLYAEISALSDNNTNRIISITDGVSVNGVSLYYSSSSNVIRANYYVGGVEQCNLQYILADETDFSKIAFVWKINRFELWVDSIKRAEDLSGAVNVANTMNDLSFRRLGSNNFFGNTKDAQVYAKALSDAELIKLTTI